MAGISARLDASFMAVRALEKPRSLRELTDLARDEHAAKASREALLPHRKSGKAQAYFNPPAQK